MLYTIRTLLFALACLQTLALPSPPMEDKSISKRQAGPLGVLPEILMVAVIDAGGPAIESFGLGGQIAKSLFGKLDSSEPYKDASNCRMLVHSEDVSLSLDRLILVLDRHQCLSVLLAGFLQNNNLGERRHRIRPNIPARQVRLWHRRHIHRSECG